MLRTDLISLINGGKMWAFIGSGVSMDAGCPSWSKLVEATIAQLSPSLGGDQTSKIRDDDRYKRGLSSGQYEHCFSRIEEVVGRMQMNSAVNSVLGAYKHTGKISKMICGWPFAGYITSNYDDLLEIGLRESGEKGWITVGNSPDEIIKISGDPQKIVWHIHGMINQREDKYHKVLTSKDYDDFYLESSPMATQLRSLLIQRRVVFIGFGFNDAEVKRLIRLVGKYSDPARPVFAFAADLAGSRHEADRVGLLENKNIDVIPYRVVDDSHAQLLGLLEMYNSMILRRNLRFGATERPCPSYDEETTGLYIYNNLVLRNRGDISETTIDFLLQSRILALLKLRGSVSVKILKDDLINRIKLIQNKKPSGELSSFDKCLDDLLEAKLITEEAPRNDNSMIKLTEKGADHLRQHMSAAKLLSEQFSQYIYDRAIEIIPENLESAKRVARTAETFLKECAKKRSLGVAMAWYAPKVEHQRYHITALLQSLPEYYQQLKDYNEGLALIKLIEDVLSKTGDEERKYLGVVLQAQFGTHLLGLDLETLKTRSKELSNSIFLVDSSTLIPLLAKSSIANHQANVLLRAAKSLGVIIVTTDLLATEVAEHARWAMEHLSNGSVAMKVKALTMALGRAGYKSNAFVEGFLEEVTLGHVSDFEQYIYSICEQACKTISDDLVVTLIRNKEIACLELKDWEGFHDHMWSERDDIQKRIAEMRKSHKPSTFKHERQVKAEAEALIVVRDLRTKILKFDGKEVVNAYFISHTRVIDQVAGAGMPITMRPESALQWMNTLTACPIEELDYLFDNLLWELSERGYSIIDRTRLHNIFSPLIDASKGKYQEEIETHRMLIAERYGVDPQKAFREVDDLDAPIVLESFYAQKARELEKKLSESDKAKTALQEQARLSGKDKEELAKLRAREKDRRKKGKSKKRAAKSRAGLKKGKKKKK